MPRDASGVLFRNDRKSKSSQPDWTGNIVLSVETMQDFINRAQNGEYRARLVSWEKDGPKGKFLSVVLNAHYEKSSQPAPSRNSDPPF